MQLKWLASVPTIGSRGLATAVEYPMDEPQAQPGLESAAVLLKPMEMAPENRMPVAADPDIHLKADLHTTGGDVKPDGPGKHKLTFRIGSADTSEAGHFGRHVDQETGVAA